MTERKENFIACGVFGGRDISVPGFENRYAALTYASLKGWREIAILRS